MTTCELTQLGDTLGDVSAALTFVAERAGNKHRERLAQLRAQALLIDQEPPPVRQLVAPTQPAEPVDDDWFTYKPVSGFVFPPPAKKTDA